MCKSPESIKVIPFNHFALGPWWVKSMTHIKQMAGIDPVKFVKRVSMACKAEHDFAPRLREARKFSESSMAFRDCLLLFGAVQHRARNPARL